MTPIAKKSIGALAVQEMSDHQKVEALKRELDCLRTRATEIETALRAFGEKS